MLSRVQPAPDQAAADDPQRLFRRIGAFLKSQGLDVEPANYTLAYHLLSDPDGPLARAVARLTDGGVRLTQRDMETLGVEAPVQGRQAAIKADGLVAQTQMQVEGFEDLMAKLRAETAGFGRDLAASADELRSTSQDGGIGIEKIARITGAMVDRVNSAEARLEQATREASELRAKLEEARDNARRDPLTNLPNRRALEEAFAAERAAGRSLALAVCDVDHFKSVNDRFGHAVGDRVLKVIAEVLGETCGDHLVARYGGEEFAVLFSDLPLDQARALLDRARVTVQGKHYRVRETDAPLGEVTFSAGVTCAVGTDEGFAPLFQRADALLYQAKSNGRNRVAAE